MTDSKVPPVSAGGTSEQVTSKLNNTGPPQDFANGAGTSQSGLHFADGPMRNFGPGCLSQADDARRLELNFAADGYAKAGWRVHPLWHVGDEGTCACDRGADCPKPGKHPRLMDWPQMASNEPGTVARWWRDASQEAAPENWYPLAGIGIAMGAESGVFALDIDPGNNGDISLAALEQAHGELPPTRIHQTGSGGQHYLFRWPDFRVGKSVSKLSRGVDIQGASSYIVAPPSISGKGSYECSNPAHDIEPADAPGWLLDWLREQDKLQHGEPVPGQSTAAPTGIRLAYAKAAVAANAEDLREAPQGRRNETLNRCAFALGQLAPDAIVDEQTAWMALSEAARACGLGEAETRATFQSGWRKGLESPFYPPWHEQGQEWPQRSWDEFGMRDRMVDHYADRVRFCAGENSWMTYRAGTWQAEEGHAGAWFAQRMIRALPVTEALGYDDTMATDEETGKLTSPRQEFVRWANKQRTRKAVSSAADLCQESDLMRIRLEECDSDPLLVNLRNGAWDARAWKHLDHDPARLLTMQAAVSYDPDASCPRWDAFLAEVQPDPEMRAYLYRIMGYSMTADTSEQAIFLHHGDGANGKSVFHGVLSRVLGSYSQTVPIQTLVTSKMESHPTDIARMRGRRYLTASEPKAGNSIDESLFKQLVGGEKVTARFMRANFFEFTPTGKIHLTSNHLLHNSAENSIMRRINLIPWEQTIEPARQDKYLADRLYQAEAPGILNRLLEGLRDWRARGALQAPARAEEAKEEYRRGEDTLGQFVEDGLIVSGNERPGLVGSSSHEIYANYVYWCKHNGIPKPMYINTLVTQLQKKGYKYHKTSKWRGFPGLTVRLDSYLP